MKRSKPIHWRVVAASVCGASHEKTAQLCQDAHHWQLLPDNILVAAVADGAGSAILGKVGAMVAVEAAIDHICEYEISSKTLESERGTRDLLVSAILNAKRAVESEAIACQKQPQDLATTLIIAIATPFMSAVAQIGDGVAVAKDYMGNLIALTLPDNGEYINETKFLISPNAVETAQIRICPQPIENLALITDGLQMLAMDMNAGLPHKPFFEPLFDFVEKVTEVKVAKEQLINFLRSDRIKQRTDDDLTLVIAGLGN